MYSKLRTGIWPNADLLAKKIGHMAENVQNGKKLDDGLELKNLSDDGNDL